MKKFLNLMLVLGLILTFAFSSFQVFGAGISSETQILENYNPYLLPDSPFYFLKTWWESIQEFFTFSSFSKADLQLKLANKRLIEAQRLVEKGKIELAQKLLERFQERIRNTIKKTEELQKQGKSIEELVAKLQANNIKHQEVLLRIYNQVPEQAKDAILNAMENSQKGFMNAIENIQDKNKREEIIKNRIKNMINGTDLKNNKERERIKEKLNIF